jgi:hypothetical protein
MRTRASLAASIVAFALATTTMASPVLASGVTPKDATPLQREEAQTRFGHARDLYAAKKLDEAHDEFEKSYAIVASPNALLFVARCDRDRGRLVAAYAEYGRTAAEAKEHAADDPRYAKTAEAANDERDALTPQLGFVTISVDRASPETTVTIGTETFGRAEWGEPVPVMPGATDVTIATPGKPSAHQSLTLVAGERKTLSLDAGPDVARPTAEATHEAPQSDGQTSAEAAASRHEMRSFAYGATIVGGVGVATFAVFGLMTNATYDDLQSQCHGPCPAGVGGSEISKGKTQQTVADVGLAVGLVGAAAAVTLFVLSLPTKSDIVALVAGPTWMGARGEF